MAERLNEVGSKERLSGRLLATASEHQPESDRQESRPQAKKQNCRGADHPCLSCAERGGERRSEDPIAHRQQAGHLKQSVSNER